jgi:hypothetical protein
VTASKGGGQLGLVVTENARRYAKRTSMANALTANGTTPCLRRARLAALAPRLMPQKLVRKSPMLVACSSTGVSHALANGRMLQVLQDRSVSDPRG